MGPTLYMNLKEYLFGLAFQELVISASIERPGSHIMNIEVLELVLPSQIFLELAILTQF